LLGVPFLFLHLTLGRGGPPDAFLPNEAEKAAMAEPLHAILDRSIRARAFAKHGDGLAFVLTTGEYLAAESVRVAEWKADRAAGEPEPPPDADLEGLHVRPPDAGEPPLRPWRPPSPPPE
jgi:hypothetical protein